MNDRIESTRQQKIGRQIQRDISEIFSKEAASLLCGIGNAGTDESGFRTG